MQAHMQARSTMPTNTIEALRERLLDIKGSKQDIDLAEVGIQLKVEQTALDAALSAAARIIPRSLMDFLK